MTITGDPVEAGLVTNLAHPGGNLTESAGRFCRANDPAIFLLDGASFKMSAHLGPAPGSAPGRVIPIGPGSVSGRAVLERQAVHVTDLQAEPESFPVGSALARELGFRTVLSGPLLGEGTTVGTIDLRAARKQGVDIPPNVHARFDEVIE